MVHGSTTVPMCPFPQPPCEVPGFLMPVGTHAMACWLGPRCNELRLPKAQCHVCHAEIDTSYVFSGTLVL